MTDVTVGRGKLEVVPLFCYLADCLSSGDGYELATITRWHVTWGKFKEPLSVITSHSFPISPSGGVHNSCARSAMLHASETWVPTWSDLHRLQRNGRGMIPWMCSVTTKDQVSLHNLLERMQLDNLTKVLRARRFRWHGHVEVAMAGWRKYRNSIPQEVVAVAALKKPAQRWVTWAA